jgi:hypothetical protein
VGSHLCSSEHCRTVCQRLKAPAPPMLEFAMTALSTAVRSGKHTASDPAMDLVDPLGHAKSERSVPL